jgi:hypothetical protein
MSRYRKIEVRTWSDEKFRALSALPPSTVKSNPMGVIECGFLEVFHV